MAIGPIDIEFERDNPKDGKTDVALKDLEWKLSGPASEKGKSIE